MTGGDAGRQRSAPVPSPALEGTAGPSNRAPRPAMRFS
jgi:hypothetical protein